MKHWHHIVPKHAGGTNDPSNLVQLTVEEHAEAHRKLYEEHGRSGDLIAWKALSGNYSKDEFHREAHSDRMKIENPMFKDSARKKISENMKKHNPMKDPKTKEKHLEKMRSPERAAKLSNAKMGNKNVRGKSWYNDGEKTGMFFECPKGWTRGRLDPHWNHKRKVNVPT